MEMEPDGAPVGDGGPLADEGAEEGADCDGRAAAVRNGLAG